MFNEFYIPVNNQFIIGQHVTGFLMRGYIGNLKLNLLVHLLVTCLLIRVPIPLSILTIKYGDSTATSDVNEMFNKTKALNFVISLLTNYSRNKWLCKEHESSNTYWIYNDNILAYQILSYYANKIGDSKFNQELKQAIQNINLTIQGIYRFNISDGNDRIEVLFENQTISYPPCSGSGYHYSPILESNMKLDYNLVYNPSLEVGIKYPDYWFQSDPELVKTPWRINYARSGSKSIGLNVSGENSNWRSNIFPVQPLQHYLVRCYIKGSVKSGTWILKIRWFNYSEPDPSKYLVGENFTWIPPQKYSNWTQIILYDFMCPSQARYADVIFEAYNGTGELYADDFEVRKIIDYGTFIVRNDRRYIQIPDWEKYGDLLLFGTLQLYWANDPSYAEYWNKVARMFDGTGIVDKVFNKSGRYDTYKLALLIIAAITINKTDRVLLDPNYENISALVKNRTLIFGKLQNPENGGVVTHYLSGFTPDPQANENVETTCLAIYACLPERDIPLIWIPEFSAWSALILLMLLLTVIVSFMRAKRRNNIEGRGRRRKR